MSSSRASLDPALKAQLEESGADDLIAAVCRLRTRSAPPTPEETLSVAEEALARVRKKTGAEPRVVNVFRNLSSVLVVAPKAFIEELLDQEEVVSAVANAP